MQTKLSNDIHTCHADCQNPACIAVREAVAAEREACAALCDEMHLYTGFDCAVAIRARGQG